MDSYTRFMEWLPAKMNEYNELMTTYTTLKEKECAVTGQSSSKRERKELLLKMKEDNTLTREENEELKFIERGDDIEDRYAGNVKVIADRKEREIKKAESDYENTLQYYKQERERSLKTLNRLYEEVKRKIESQKKRIEGERNLSVKTGVEITLEQDKRRVLQQMQKLISIIETSRKTQVSPEYRDKLPPVPALPETIVTQYVAPIVEVPIVEEPTESITEYYKDEAIVARGREEIRERRAEQKRKDREREIEEAHRPPTVYGFIADLEKRPHVKPTYVAVPVTDDGDVINDFFTKD